MTLFPSAEILRRRADIGLIAVFFALVWQPYWDKPVIEREKPDIVIDEILQRVLIFLDPEDARKNDERMEPAPATK